MGKPKPHPGPGKHLGGHHRTKPKPNLPPAVREMKNVREVVDLQEAMEEVQLWQPKKKKL